MQCLITCVLLGSILEMDETTPALHENITLSCRASILPSATQYSFYKDGVQIDSSSSGTYAFSVGADQSGNYTCQATQPLMSQMSENVSMVVICK